VANLNHNHEYHKKIITSQPLILPLCENQPDFKILLTEDSIVPSTSFDKCDT